MLLRLSRASLKLSAACLGAAGLLTLAACGSNPAGSSGEGVNLRGMVLDQGTASTVFGVSRATTASGGAQAAGDALTVTVLGNEAISATVGEDGSFTLRGLPEGDFTLVFKSASGGVLGMLTFSQVKANQEITITVQVTAGGLLLVEERRNGIGHGDLEIEGVVDQVLNVSTSGDSTFVIKGYTVVARPGQTAIREGNRTRTVEDVTQGRQVHVKGVWLSPADSSGSTQQVLADEIKLQGSEDGDGDDEKKITICHKKKNTISVSLSAWPAHQAHGDTMGACK